MTKSEYVKLWKVAEDICDVIYADSRVFLEGATVWTALQKDWTVSPGHFLSREEVEALVMGDEDGTVSQHLKDAFLNTDALLSSQF